MSDGIPSPNSDFPQPIKNVTGNANVKIQNKNLVWNGWAEDCVSRIDNQYAAKITVKDDRNCLSFSANAGFGDYAHKYIFKTDFKENTQYTFAFDILSTTSNLSNFNMTIYYTDGTNTPIVKVSNNNWNKFVIASAPNKTIKYVTSYYTDGTRYLDLDTFMVLEGAYTAQTIPDYVPHQEQNYLFTFAEGQRGMQGTQLLDDGIHNTRKQIVLDGTENWKFHSEIDGVYRYSLNGGSFLNKFVGIKTGTNADGDFRDTFCNYFYYIYGDFNNKMLGSFSINNVASANWFFVQTNFEDLATFKQWLATKYANGTPVIVEYELAESALENNIIPYNETQQAQYNAMKQAKTYKGITYITSESEELAPELKIQYWKERGTEE